MTVRLLTEEQKNLLIDQKFEPFSYFNPIQDANDNWIISQEEVDNCIYEEFFWIKQLPIIEYIIKEFE